MAYLATKDVMTAPVRTVRSESSVEETAELLATHHISGAPVVDDEGHVLGIVSEADLIDEHKREARIPRLSLFGLFPLPDDVLREAARSGTMLRAGDLMTKQVVTAAEDTSVHELADLMVRHKINRIPIVRDGRLVGIVTRGDLMRALAQAKGR